jgi:hypothetical protein
MPRMVMFMALESLSCHNRKDCNTEARSTVSMPASFAAVAVPGWSPIAKPSP